ncbi:MAG: nucleoside hydrolase [Chloroflexota bacterium]
MATERLPLILDVDTGIDDALALALALGDPHAELVAATTVAGNVDVDQATANTLRVLDFLGATHVPVHRGASKPLVRELRDARYFHGRDGLGEAPIPASQRQAELVRGPAAIIRLARERPGQIVLVCLGPLTNLAIALNVAPDLPAYLRRIVIMGGAFWQPGNVTAHAEFNIYVDPEAAAEVVAVRNLDVTVLGLDVTHRVALPKAVWVDAAGRDNPAAKLVAAICPWMETHHRKTGMFLHDPMAVAAALDPTLVTCAERSVTVSCAPETRGETLAVRAGHVKVAEHVDGGRFAQRFANALGLQWLEMTNVEAM